MKIINKETFFPEHYIGLLSELIGVTITSIDFNDLISYVRYNSELNFFEIGWPNNLTLVSHNGMNRNVNLNFEGEIFLNELKDECIDFKINSSNKDYSNGGGISIDWFEICKIDIYCNSASRILDDKNYGDLHNDLRINFVHSHNCNELEFIEASDEIILFTSKNKKKLLLQVIESLNGVVILHFNESHIDQILSNKYHVRYPLKNYTKRLTIE